MTADSATSAMRSAATPRMLRLPVVAALLGLSESAVRRGVVAGNIPSKRLGKTILIPEAWVTEFTAWDGSTS